MSAQLVLRAATAADLMTRDPVSLPADATTAAAAAFLTSRHFGAAVATDDAGRPVGVVTKTDLLAHARQAVTRAVPVRDVMTPAVFSVGDDTPARSVVEHLLALNVHHLFVTDVGGVVVGVITPVDVLRKLA